MQGKLIFVAFVASALTPSVAMAADAVKRQTCAKNEVQPQQTRNQQRQQGQQQRTRTLDCKATRDIPPVVDPTPYFLL
jgi:heme exporter protein D